MSRVTLVTGGSRGIGAACCLLAAKQGWSVAVNYTQNSLAADEVVRQIRAAGGQAIAVQADVGDEAQIQKMFETVDAKLGRLSALVNNAGVPLGMSTSLRTFEHLSSSDFERQLDLNFRAVVNLCRELLPAMRTQKFGRIVTISSESWRLGQAMGLSDYAAAKAATIGFMRNLCKEVGPDGITANVLSLGAMNNYGYDDIARKVTAVGRAGTPEDVGAAVTYLVSREASWMTGQTIPLNGGSATA